ncbi:uncharacterized protein LOC110006478 [Amborella trichopoda]|uniref:uncharacterized protein LOC110006478 n=1 Tax=Amborella trichopoda TaxID=13333 RepID=UPI0009C0A7E5|nr:uncharacterized protein LOC110006478 [Amborella trichopoda]|eukprot:XP_020517700.1 uncharacterized protein LOC110006478 [Amborella trichopoda]
MVTRQRTKIDPATWWSEHGCSARNLQKLVIQILNQTTTSSDCERNCNTFEMIHTKKRNKLESKRLNDLIYIKIIDSRRTGLLREIRETPLRSKNMDNAME